MIFEQLQQTHKNDAKIDPETADESIKDQPNK